MPSTMRNRIRKSNILSTNGDGTVITTRPPGRNNLADSLAILDLSRMCSRVASRVIASKESSQMASLLENFWQRIGACLRSHFLCKADQTRRLARFFPPAMKEILPDDSQYPIRGFPAESSARPPAFSIVGLNGLQFSFSYFTRYVVWVDKKQAVCCKAYRLRMEQFTLPNNRATSCGWWDGASGSTPGLRSASRAHA